MKRLLCTILFLSLLACSSIFAYSICDGQVTFSIPSELEVQSGVYKEINELFAQNLERSGYDCVLQQKGLNDFDPDAMGRYCRILIRRMIDSSAAILTNELYRDMFGLFSKTEQKDFFDEFFDALMGRLVINEIRDYGTCDIGGKFAIYYGVVRESVSDQGDVLLYSCMIPCGETIFTIEAAYRISEEKRFAPAVKQFFDTLQFNVSEAEYLSSVKIPGTARSFLWPEANPSWTVTAKDSFGTSRVAISDQLLMRGYLASVGVASFNKAQTTYRSVYPGTLLNNGYKTYSQSALPGKKLLENKTSNGVGSLRYSYRDSSSGITVYGLGKYFFVDDYTLISLEFEYLDEALDEIKEIIKSFGINY